MGNRNVDRLILALPPITDIPPTTWRCLLLMAKAAHDDTQLYWAGTGFLVIHLGYSTGASGRRAVMRHLAILESAGYISRTSKTRGHRRIYELHLGDPLGHLSTGHDPWS
jgi:hypothetical protein